MLLANVMKHLASTQNSHSVCLRDITYLWCKQQRLNALAAVPVSLQPFCQHSGLSPSAAPRQHLVSGTQANGLLCCNMLMSC